VEKAAYFVKCEDVSASQGCKIYKSVLQKNNQWSNPQVLNFCKKSSATFTNPFVVWIAGQQIMFFSSDMQGGCGGMDIWQINLTNPNAQAVNLGNVINTQGNEVTPFYSLDDNTLYFSSDTQYGFGGFDIFSSKGMGNQWEQPVNMQKPINSSMNDLYPAFYNHFGYLTSNRDDIVGTTCCNHIYFWTKDVTTTTKDTAIYSPPVINSSYLNLLNQAFSPDFDLPLRLYFHNDEPDPYSKSNITDLDYEQCWLNYTKLKDNYSDYYRNSKNEEGEKKIAEFFEQHLDYGMKKLDAMMNWLLKQMQEGKSIDIQIRGYASSLSTDYYNLILSTRRINSIENYMERWNDGILASYLDLQASDGKPRLNVIHLPLGNTQSISENPQNQSERINSVFTLSAMQERKIEIQIIKVRE